MTTRRRMVKSPPKSSVPGIFLSNRFLFIYHRLGSAKSTRGWLLQLADALGLRSGDARMQNTAAWRPFGPLSAALGSPQISRLIGMYSTASAAAAVKASCGDVRRV